MKQRVYRAKGEEKSKIRQRHKAIKTEGEFFPLKFTGGRVFDSSASAGESRRDTACQK